MRIILQLSLLAVMMLVASAAFGQDTGGMRAVDVAPTADARMLNIPPTPVLIVTAHGSELVRSHYADWQSAVEEGRVICRANANLPTVAEAARQNQEDRKARGLSVLSDKK